MLQSKRLLSALLVLPAVYAFTTPVEDFKFAVASGAALSRSIVQETEMSLDDMAVFQNEQDMSGMMGKFEITAKNKMTVKVSDKFLEMGDGSPTKLQRTYEALGNSTSMSMQADNPMIPSQDRELQGKSELEGKIVLFTRDGDDYKKTFGEDTAGDDEMLAGLEEDMDFRGMVPQGSKNIGDTWSIELPAFKKVLAPGGNLRIEVESDGAEDMGFGGMGSEGSLADQLGDLEGEVKAEFTKVDREGGGKIAVVKLTFEIKSAQDMSEKARESIEKNKDKMQGAEVEIESADVELKFKGEGELRWNLAANHLQSIDLSGEMGMAMENAMKMDVMGTSMRMRMSMDMSGTFSQKIEIAE
ncbi:MAG: hypothetical protein EPO68_08850 [Planctomycetota bacterium]|nr:MAG: hypothetical protein EPO68_08850 [Planctomycetota bacterium]